MKQTELFVDDREVVVPDSDFDRSEGLRDSYETIFNEF